MYILELAGEDDTFAAAEAHAAADDITIIGPGVATAASIDPDRITTLAFTHRAAKTIAIRSGGIPDAVSILSDHEAPDSGTVAVRARDVRGTAAIDTRTAERQLGTILVEKGCTVDLDAPDHELRAVFTDSTVALGWLETTSNRDYGAREPTNRPFFQPGGMSPQLARALVNLALPTRASEAVLIDPMCGTAGILIEAGLIGATPIGVDAQHHMVAGARQNLAAYLDTPFAVLKGDVTSLPIREEAGTAVVVDVPYGRQSKIAGYTYETLIEQALAETARISSRGVVVASHALTDELTASPWTLTARYERRVHRSLVRHIHVVTRPEPS